MSVMEATVDYEALTAEELVAARYEKFRRMGRWAETP